MKEKNNTHQQQSGFRTPDNYFENLEAKLAECIFPSSNKDTLQNIPKNSGFHVPSNYFEELESKLSSKITTQKSGKVIRTKFSRNWWYTASAIAAIFILLFMINPFAKQQTSSWDDVELSAMEQYINQGYIDFSEADFSTIMGNDYLVEESSFYNMSTDAVVDYLDQNVEDPTYILE